MKYVLVGKVHVQTFAQFNFLIAHLFYPFVPRYSYSCNKIEHSFLNTCVTELRYSYACKYTVPFLFAGDYKSLCGEIIPFRKFGFSNFQSFAASIPDVLQVIR